MAKLLLGKPVADELNEDTKGCVERHKVSTLAILKDGENIDSENYVNSIVRQANKLGIDTDVIQLDEYNNDNNLLMLSKMLNDEWNNYLILPIEPISDEMRSWINRNLYEEKDVDCFMDCNKKYGYGKTSPNTPYAVMELLEYYDIDIQGKNVVIIGRSDTVGTPLALLFLEANATVTVCHSKTENIKTHTQNADILVSAVGIPKFVTKDMVKEGAVIIDVGINDDGNGGICGDIDFDAVEPIVNAITPVPRGVGAVTTAVLLNNVAIW